MRFFQKMPDQPWEHRIEITPGEFTYLKALSLELFGAVYVQQNKEQTEQTLLPSEEMMVGYKCSDVAVKPLARKK